MFCGDSVREAEAEVWIGSLGRTVTRDCPHAHRSIPKATSMFGLKSSGCFQYRVCAASAGWDGLVAGDVMARVGTSTGGVDETSVTGVAEVTEVSASDEVMLIAGNDTEVGNAGTGEAASCCCCCVLVTV